MYRCQYVHTQMYIQAATEYFLLLVNDTRAHTHRTTERRKDSSAVNSGQQLYKGFQKPRQSTHSLEFAALFLSCGFVRG